MLRFRCCQSHNQIPNHLSHQYHPATNHTHHTYKSIVSCGHGSSIQVVFISLELLYFIYEHSKFLLLFRLLSLRVKRSFQRKEIEWLWRFSQFKNVGIRSFSDILLRYYTTQSRKQTLQWKTSYSADKVDLYIIA